MKYRNSSVYVQTQINRILRSFTHFVKTYIDDIIIFSKFFDEYISYLRKFFDILFEKSISINSKKVFIEYFSIILLS